MTTIERLKADLRALKDTDRILIWGGWDKPYPPGPMFREYLVRSDELLAALEGEESPEPTTITVRVNSSNGLNVRKAPIDGEKVTTLPDKSVIAVYEEQRPAGWYKISGGLYAGYFVSAQYVVKV